MYATEASSDVLPADSNSAELTTWDFLQDLDFGLQPEPNAPSLPPGSDGVGIRSAERLKEKNRKAQQRMRQRNKASSSWTDKSNK